MGFLTKFLECLHIYAIVKLDPLVALLVICFFLFSDLLAQSYDFFRLKKHLGMDSSMCSLVLMQYKLLLLSWKCVKFVVLFKVYQCDLKLSRALYLCVNFKLYLFLSVEGLNFFVRETYFLHQRGEKISLR